jgi:hypothetical protein
MSVFTGGLMAVFKEHINSLIVPVLRQSSIGNSVGTCPQNIAGIYHALWTKNTG